MKEIKKKLSEGSGTDNLEEYDYGNHWFRESTTGPMRLVIGPTTGHIDLMIALARPMPEPIGVLYVLLHSRRGEHKPGRYQSGQPVSHSDVEKFLRTHQSFFESDARHHIWIMSISSDAVLVYDHHNIIYAYGPLGAFELILREFGLTERIFGIPSPHSHYYHEKGDDAERSVMGHWDWMHFPLQAQDDE